MSQDHVDASEFDKLQQCCEKPEVTGEIFDTRTIAISPRQSRLDDGSNSPTGRSRKRPKLSPGGLSTYRVASEPVEGFLTLERTELRLHFHSDTFPEIAKTRELYDKEICTARQSEAVKLLRVEQTEAHQSNLYITSKDDRLLPIRELRGGISESTKSSIDRAVALSLSRHPGSFRAHFTVSSCPENGARAAFVLSIRIIVEDANDLDGYRSPAYSNEFGLSRYIAREPSLPASSWTPQDFYEHVHKPSKSCSSDDLVNTDLSCRLYPFQQQAVSWMLRRERIRDTQEHFFDDLGTVAGIFLMLDADGQPCWMIPALNIISSKEHLRSQIGRYQPVGILAEEMGLGKTVEILALISLDRQKLKSESFPNHDKVESQCSATLIITPPALVEQWQHEITVLAPHLSVMIYHGLKIEGKTSQDSDILAKFNTCDIVLVTYLTLGKEIHYAQQKERKLRHEQRFERRRSLLVQVQWRRVILDEAQMIERGSNNPARVASLIPRKFAWCVSGTPVRSAMDLYGLLLFLHYEPHCRNLKDWLNTVAYDRPLVHAMVEHLTLRHTKADVRHELQLPRQDRIIITVNFNAVEQQNYDDLFAQMARECCMDSKGAPLVRERPLNDDVKTARMRSWLIRLRQTCLHMEVGKQNRRALGNERGPLRPLAQVLDVMIEQNQSSLQTARRGEIADRIRRGQLHESIGHIQDCLEIWSYARKDAEVLVQHCRQLITTEDAKLAEKHAHSPDQMMTRENENSQSPARHRLGLALDILHQATFFVANACYQLKEAEIRETSGVPSDEIESGSEELISLPMTRKACELEEQENHYYAEARGLRRELLKDIRHKALGSIDNIRNRKVWTSFSELRTRSDFNLSPEYSDSSAQEIGLALSKQVSLMVSWRDTARDLLLDPLLDVDDDQAHRGTEYEESANIQDQIYVYIDCLRWLCSDLLESISGRANSLDKHESRLAYDAAKQGQGHCPQLMMSMQEKRCFLKPGREVRSLQSAIALMKRREISRKGPGMSRLDTLLDCCLKEHSQLDKELDIFRYAMNQRLEYYRQLQAISDHVTVLEGSRTNSQSLAEITGLMERGKSTQKSIALLEGRARYLSHLQKEYFHSNVPRQCIICMSGISKGLLTSCGHLYCSDCLYLWWQQHGTCPSCKRHLQRTDFHLVSYAATDIVPESQLPDDDEVNASLTSCHSQAAVGIFLPQAMARKMKAVKIEETFGSKIDAIIRLLICLRAQGSDTCKTVIFSQYREFIGVLGKAFTRAKIGFSSIDRRDGVQQFQADPSIECFFLHAKAQSSGLNLVNARHIILCEPLINPAIELQAIARIHRIGQHHTTTVWTLLVQGTVEPMIHRISAERRLSEAKKTQANSSGDVGEYDESTQDGAIEASESKQIELHAVPSLMAKDYSAGEIVQDQDLWRCLFNEIAHDK